MNQNTTSVLKLRKEIDQDRALREKLEKCKGTNNYHVCIEKLHKGSTIRKTLMRIYEKYSREDFVEIIKNYLRGNQIWKNYWSSVKNLYKETKRKDESPDDDENLEEDIKSDKPQKQKAPERRFKETKGISLDDILPKEKLRGVNVFGSKRQSGNEIPKPFKKQYTARVYANINSRQPSISNILTQDAVQNDMIVFAENYFKETLKKIEKGDEYYTHAFAEKVIETMSRMSNTPREFFEKISKIVLCMKEWKDLTLNFTSLLKRKYYSAEVLATLTIEEIFPEALDFVMNDNITQNIARANAVAIEKIVNQEVKNLARNYIYYTNPTLSRTLSQEKIIKSGRSITTNIITPNQIRKWKDKCESKLTLLAPGLFDVAENRLLMMELFGSDSDDEEEQPEEEVPNEVPEAKSSFTTSSSTKTFCNCCKKEINDDNKTLRTIKKDGDSYQEFTTCSIDCMLDSRFKRSSIRGGRKKVSD